MSKPVIAVDMDEVLFPFTAQFLNWHNQKHGTAVELGDLETYYYIEELLGVDSDDVEAVIENFLSTTLAHNSEPHDGAIEALGKLKEKYQIDVITARKSTTRKDTERWLKKNFPETFRGIHFSRSAEELSIPKSELCKKLGTSILIDDHVENVMDCAAAGIKVLHFGDYPWSNHDKSPDGVAWVKNWDEALKELL